MCVLRAVGDITLPDVNENITTLTIDMHKVNLPDEQT